MAPSQKMKRVKRGCYFTNDVLRNIFLYMEVFDVIKVSRVNWQFNKISYDPYVMKKQTKMRNINIKEKLFKPYVSEQIYDQPSTLELLEKQKKDYLEQTYFFKSLNDIIKIGSSYNCKGILIQIALIKTKIPYIKYYNTKFSDTSMEFVNNMEFFSNNGQKIITSRKGDVSVDLTKIFWEFLVMKSKRSCCDFYKQLLGRKGFISQILPTSKTNPKLLFALCFDESKIRSNEMLESCCRILSLDVITLGTEVIDYQNGKYEYWDK